jgi:hypothetical protein
MRKLKLIAFILLIASCAQPAVAQEQGSPFNLHIGGGIGTPLNPTANFAGVSGAFQVGGGPNITNSCGRVCRVIARRYRPFRI